MNSKLYKIPLPSQEPVSIDDYKKQNYLLQIIPQLSLCFDGMKLGNWDSENRGLPYVLAGSVIEFNGSLYEAKEDIIFIDECPATPIDRYIVFYQDNDDTNYIKVKMANNNFPSYLSQKRGFYKQNSNSFFEKYLRVYMKKEKGMYHSKMYWDKDDVNRNVEGDDSALKKYTKIYSTPGTFTFPYPMNAESVVFHIMGAGGESGNLVWVPSGNQMYVSYARSGGLSKLLVDSNTITTCNGGQGGALSFIFPIDPTNPGGQVTGVRKSNGIGGTATGSGKLFNGNKGVNQQGGMPPNKTLATGGRGGNAKDKTYSSGGSGSCAIVEVLRSELGSSNTVTLTVGARGSGSSSNQNPGQNGSVYVEWYE